MKYKEPWVEYRPAGGVLLGIQGTSSHHLHSLDFITTKSKIASVRLENITVSPNAGELNALHDKGLEEEHKAVNRHVQEDFDVAAKDSITMSVAFSVSDSTTLEKTSSDAFTRQDVRHSRRPCFGKTR
jgi:hypothetical protein